MREPTNDQRANWALETVEKFARITGMRNERNHEDLDTIIGDLLCDIMHLCDREDINFTNLLRRAELHHREELQIERGEDVDDSAPN